MKLHPQNAAFTLSEVLIAAAVSGSVLAAMAVGSIALQKNMVGQQEYASHANNGSRMVDYISRDLRNAIRVSHRQSSTTTAFKSGSVTLSKSDAISIFVPDYYLTNTPDNRAASSYKTSRFSRANLASGTTYYAYDDAVQVIGVTRVPKYASELEIRYTRRARSAADPTLCYFRSEYDSAGTLKSESEVAERVEPEQLTVLALDPNRFRISSSFDSRWTGDTYRTGTRQFTTVKILNKRRD